MRSRGGWAVNRRIALVSLMVGLAAFWLLVRPLHLTMRDNVSSTVVFVLGAWLTARPSAQGRFLPLARTVVPSLGPVLAGLVLGSYSEISLADVFTPAMLAVMLLDAGFMAVVSPYRPRRDGQRRVRVAVVGSPEATASLVSELAAQSRHTFEIVGFVHPGTDAPRGSAVPYLGNQSALATIVAVNRIDLLLASAEAPRLPLFEEIARSCLNLPVRVMELAVFYEETFGHVALAAINASWFQYLMHPRYSRETPAIKRAFDLAIALPTLVVTAPLMAVLALLVRMDGGPVLYRQTRIGEGGRRFEILKLRSMRVGSDTGPQWSSRDDERVTGIGSLMRRTHLDELPQLFNVIRGEMSIVGPRPEQPAVVKDLELTIPFYSRRHLVRPGITGWAQVQCGYAGSHNGSALKACYDLYYIKHRSVRLDCLILIETVRTFVADRQWHDMSAYRAFAHAGELHGPATSIRELSRLPEPVQDAS